MGEFQNSVQNELAAIIGFSQRENRASWQFEDAAWWRRQQHVQPRRRLGFIAAKLPMASWAETWVAAYWRDSELTLPAMNRPTCLLPEAATGTIAPVRHIGAVILITKMPTF